MYNVIKVIFNTKFPGSYTRFKELLSPSSVPPLTSASEENSFIAFSVVCFCLAYILGFLYPSGNSDVCLGISTGMSTHENIHISFFNQKIYLFYFKFKLQRERKRDTTSTSSFPE